MTEYEELLKRARKNAPAQTAEAARFEMPKFDSFIQGYQTIIKNFTEVAKILHREPSHLQKFIFGVAGASGELDDTRLILNGNKTTDFLNSKLELYVNEFVLCKECKKPDTEIRTEDGSLKIKCKACSVKYDIRKI